MKIGFYTFVKRKSGPEILLQPHKSLLVFFPEKITYKKMQVTYHVSEGEALHAPFTEHAGQYLPHAVGVEVRRRPTTR